MGRKVNGVTVYSENVVDLVLSSERNTDRCDREIGQARGKEGKQKRDARTQ